MKRVPLTLAVVALGLLASRAHPQSVQSFGVIERLGFFCTVIETDDGQVFGLSETGAFGVGERVWVTGDPVGFLACGELAVVRLDNTIAAAFAGTGHLTADPRGPRLVTPTGELYALGNDGGFQPGTEIFVKGVVVGSRGGPPIIDVVAIGAARSAFAKPQPIAHCGAI